MGVNTLGDLVRTSEAELLGSKNFGENIVGRNPRNDDQQGSLLGHVRQMKKSWKKQHQNQKAIHLTNKLYLERPLSEMNLSVRARKCMVRLGLNTIGELVRKTQDELWNARTSA